MPGQWDYLPEGDLTPGQVDQLVTQLTVGWSVCPPGWLPTPPDRRDVGWAIAALGVRPERTVVDQIHAAVRARILPAGG